MIVACLCWYDEEPDMLARCVASLEGVADALVALDGPFANHPHDDESSPSEQREAILRAASRAELELVLPEPAVYETQAQKRTALLSYGTAFAWRESPGHPSWLLVIDADERVDMVMPRWEQKLWRSGERGAHCALVRGPSATRMPRLIRARIDLAYDGAHNRLVCSDGVVFDGSPYLPHADLFGWLGIAHDRRLRPRERLMDANRYRVARRKAGER